MNAFITGLVSYLLTSPQFQSLERSALKGAGVWLVSHGVTQANAESAMTSIVSGAIAIAVGLLSSARNTAASTANAPIAQNTPTAT